MIKKGLDEYLEFDSLLYNLRGMQQYPLVRIFGGAIRDIIANKTIHDIDILVGARSYQPIKFVLESQGYHLMENLVGKDIQSIYHDIKVINEPMTFIKNTKIVQVIRPQVKVTNVMHPVTLSDSGSDADGTISSYGWVKLSGPEKENIYRQSFIELLQNVDLSCCGVSWNGNDLVENFPGAIMHCLTKSFIVNRGAKMYSDKRAEHRIVKLESRGWARIDTSMAAERDNKLDCLLNDRIENISYVTEYESHTIGFPRRKSKFKI